MSHRFIWFAMFTNAVFTDCSVARSTDIRPLITLSRLFGSYGGPPIRTQLSQEEDGKLCPVEPLTLSFNECPSISHWVSTNALNVDPVWNPLDPPCAWSPLKLTMVARGSSSVGEP